MCEFLVVVVVVCITYRMTCTTFGGFLLFTNKDHVIDNDLIVSSIYILKCHLYTFLNKFKNSDFYITQKLKLFQQKYL